MQVTKCRLLQKADNGGRIAYRKELYPSRWEENNEAQRNKGLGPIKALQPQPSF